MTDSEALQALWERVLKLESKVGELDRRTVGMIRLGPSERGPTSEEIAAGAQRIIDAVKERESPPPVDRTQRVLTDGTPVTADHRELKPDGQQKGYVVLTAEERAKGFVRPVRTKYVHTKCGVVTHMGRALAETYARDPSFYNGTFCAGCHKHFPLAEFVWDGTQEMLGS